MPQANIYFSDEESSKIVKTAKRWSLNKHETVRRMVREHKINVKEMRKTNGSV